MAASRKNLYFFTVLLTGCGSQPIPGADLCRLFAYMAAYCIAHINRSNLSLPYVRWIC